MSRGEICLSMVTGEPSSSSESAQDEKLPNSWIKLKGILTQDKKYQIIQKVPHRLRQVNEKAYEPNVISIGPYHHGKPHLKEMEDIKKSFFIKAVGESKENFRKLINPDKAKEAKLLDKSEKELEDLEAEWREKKKIKVIKDLETVIRDDLERIKECYAEPLDVKFDSEEEFVDMVLFDGFFIVQFIREICPEIISRRGYIFDEIFMDLLLLENQLPFFVLVKLHQIITQNEETEEEFIDISLEFFETVRNSECPIRKENIKHLLHLIHGTWSPSDQNQSQPEPEPEPQSQSQSQPLSESQSNSKSSSKSKSRFIPCARELEEAGISFEIRDEEKEKCRALDIEFKRNFRKPKLRIPKLVVDDYTERMLRNLLAFEQFLPFEEPTYVFDYVDFLDQLINSGQDVQLLCNSGIIENWLGDYEVVANVFNRLGDHTCGSPDYYSGIFKQVNDHCDDRWNKHMANFHRNYFNSPWALLSFLAAVILLFVAFAQTLLALKTADCHLCVVLFIVFVVLLIVICFLLYMCLR